MIYEGITITLIIIGLSAILWSYFNDTNTPVINKKQSKENLNDDYYEEYSARIEELNQKILELNEYGGFLKNELDNKHKELMFLYQLIHEKTKDIRQNIDLEPDMSLMGECQPIDDNNIKIIEDVSNLQEGEMSQQINFNQLILELSKKGYSIKEIAQLLEVGQGEVKLVLDLYEWGVIWKKRVKY